MGEVAVLHPRDILKNQFNRKHRNNLIQPPMKSRKNPTNLVASNPSSTPAKVRRRKRSPANSRNSSRAPSDDECKSLVMGKVKILKRGEVLTDDDWIRAALTDDAVVVELLLRLWKSSSSEPSSKPPCSIPLPPQKWGLRQTRSKPVTVIKKESATTTTTNTRFSPTTPLTSWSGGATSPSDGGYDESSRLPSDPSSSVRSKPFSELKEDDNLVLKEKLHLRKVKQELASTRMTVCEQDAWSHNVKRMKLDLNLQSTFEVSKQIEASTTEHRLSPSFELASSHSCKLKDKETSNGGFILPDLNMMPLEGETGSESFY
ncbi:unnamed protein product [Fraxinus pennsylvanica]|uniref:Uncharacterized protein n=1 Tax=Fraxinus pennsylvanica TaxID=56036 RepID=A0AAD1ZKI1_9LAMI|nr:unnamed protein product [Fraxinus pennsylvanica]